MLALEQPPAASHKYRIRKRPRLVAIAFAKLDRDFHFLCAAVDGDRDTVARTFAIQQKVHVELVGDFLAVEGHDNVAADNDAPHSGLLCAVTTVNSCHSRRAALR